MASILRKQSRNPNQLRVHSGVKTLPLVPARLSHCREEIQHCTTGTTQPITRCSPVICDWRCATAVRAGITAINWLEFEIAKVLDKGKKERESMALDFLCISDCGGSQLQLYSFARKFILLQKTWAQGSSAYQSHNLKSLSGSQTDFADVSCVFRHCFCTAIQ